MQLLYSNILPMKSKDGQTCFLDAFSQSMQEADRLDVAVGYASRGSLETIEELLRQYPSMQIRVNLGMYFIEGMPEGMYNTARLMAQKWQARGCGQIKLVRPFKYHGKLYIFYRNGQPFRAFIGSHNLGAIHLEGNNRRQYELSVQIDEPAEVRSAAGFADELWQDKCALDILSIQHPKLVREKNLSLDGVQEASQIPPATVELYEHHKTNVSFRLKLKVPAFADRLLDDGHHYTKSNINVCYAAPRSKRKARDWYEIQVTVSAKVYRMEGYPEHKKPFFVVTDDGYWFKGHTTSDNNKQFNAVGNELLVGRWLKGRLAAAGLVKPVNDTLADRDRQGIISQEILAAYGCDTLVFTRTDQKALDTDGSELDIWVLSFEAGNGEDEQ